MHPPRCCRPGAGNIYLSTYVREINCHFERSYNKILKKFKSGKFNKEIFITKNVNNIS